MECFVASSQQLRLLTFSCNNLTIGPCELQAENNMSFGSRVRQLRQSKGYTLRDLAALVGVTFTYLSKIENQKLSFGDFPSDELILKLANELKVDADELLLLAEKVPLRIRRRVIERPEVFRRLASLDDEQLDGVLAYLGLSN
jgi:transcriptional regulator with XRE-family HTH domain